MERCYLIIALGALLSSWLPACSSEGTCTPRDHTHCTMGNTYWADSCGNLGEVKETCRCGCTADHKACRACDCGACNTPPEAKCKDANTLITYEPEGTCQNGTCRYSPSEIGCPRGCDPAARACRDCMNSCSSSGDAECSEGRLRTCVADAQGCLAWGEYTDCPQGFCADGASCGTCDHRCGPAGATECNAGRIRNCVADSNGCRAWDAFSDCTDGFCANETSCGVCDHQCPRRGAAECVGGRIRSCVADSNGCRAWGAFSDCADGFCQDATSCGNCDNQCPQAGDSECTSGRIRTCTADGHGCRDWTAFEACPDGFCADASTCGRCNHECAQQGLAECTNGQSRECLADGNGCRYWSDYQACPDGFCQNATACGVCHHACSSEDATECTGGRIRTCTADGHGCRDWTAFEACPDGFCESATACGTCLHECDAVGDVGCHTDRLGVCAQDENGCRILPQQTCELGCAQSACTVCDHVFDPTVGSSDVLLNDGLDVAISGNLAIVADGVAGLKIFDIADPAHPTLLVSHPVSAAGVAISGQRAFVAGGSAGLVIVDLQIPTSPQTLGSVATNDARDVVVVGSHAYVADGLSPAGGLKVIDVSDVNNPTIVGRRITPSQASAVDLYGDHALVACEDGGLEVIDISDPTSPTWTANYSGQYYDVVVQGGLAYLTYNARTSGRFHSGLSVVDVHDPANPTRLGELELESGSPKLKLAVEDRYVYVVNSPRYDLLKIDAIDPRNPAVVGQYRNRGVPYQKLAVSSAMAYLVSRGTGLLVLDTQNLFRAAVLETFDVDFIDVKAVGPYAYLVVKHNTHWYERGLQIVDITDPDHPALSGQLDISWARALDVVGNRVYVAREYYNSKVLSIIDVNVRDRPVLIGTLELASQDFLDVVVRDDLAYAAAGSAGLVVIDVSIAADPRIVGRCTDVTPRSVDVSGDYAYVASARSLKVVEIANPTHPLLAGEYLFANNVSDAHVEGNLAYVVGSRHGLKILDVSNPLDIREVGSTFARQTYQRVTVAESVALVVAYNTTQIVDVRDPQSPRGVHSIASPFGISKSFHGVSVQGNIAYIAGDAGLTIQRICLP